MPFLPLSLLDSLGVSLSEHFVKWYYRFSCVWELTIVLSSTFHFTESGFTAMMGHILCDCIERLCKKCKKHQSQRQVVHAQGEYQVRLDDTPNTQQSFQQAPNHEDGEVPQLLHHHTPRRENSVLLKNQRRQKSRLRHHQVQK